MVACAPPKYRAPRAAERSRVGSPARDPQIIHLRRVPPAGRTLAVRVRSGAPGRPRSGEPPAARGRRRRDRGYAATGHEGPQDGRGPLGGTRPRVPQGGHGRRRPPHGGGSRAVGGRGLVVRERAARSGRLLRRRGLRAATMGGLHRLSARHPHGRGAGGPWSGSRAKTGRVAPALRRRSVRADGRPYSGRPAFRKPSKSAGARKLVWAAAAETV